MQNIRGWRIKVVPVTWNPVQAEFDSEEEDITEEQRFLGLEFDDVVKEWDKEIEKCERELKKEEEEL